MNEAPQDVLVINNGRMMSITIKSKIKGNFSRDDHGKVSDLIDKIDKLVKAEMHDKIVETKI